MIKEYALDPEMLLDWRNFRYYYESNFGIQNGRLIIGLPSPAKWASIIRNGIKKDKSMKPVKRKSLTNKLNQALKLKVISRTPNNWNDKNDWLINTEDEFDHMPFQAIIANENPRGKGYVLVDEDIDADNPLWGTNGQIEVVRNANKMSECVRILLQKSTTIIFIDPHFDQSKPRFQNTLESFLDVAMQNHTNNIKQVEFHLSTRYDRGFEEDCERHLPQLINNSLQVSFKQIKEKDNGEKLHDRYILTDVGGVEFTVGLDEQPKRKTQETTGVKLLEDDLCRSLWNQYMSNDPAFDLEREVIIQGTKEC